MQEPASKITLRVARSGDVEALYSLLLGYFAHLTLPYPGPNTADTVAWLHDLCAANTVVVAECDGQIIGSVAMEVCEFRWNRSAPYLHGHWLYVAPEYRKSRTVFALLDGAKAIAETNRMLLLMGNIWDEVPAECFGRIMGIAGFVPAGNAFLFAPTALKPNSVN